mgnify:CR=1 FL=1
MWALGGGGAVHGCLKRGVNGVASARAWLKIPNRAKKKSDLKLFLDMIDSYRENILHDIAARIRLLGIEPWRGWVN